MEKYLNKAVFLDRDGVINDGSLYYTYRKEDFIINKGVFESLRLLQKAGYLLVVITNQGGVAKGQYKREDVERLHQYMDQVFSSEGIHISQSYYCPHHSDVSECECRKPKPGMLIQAIEDHHIAPALSYMIGDSQRDIQAAEAAGVKGIKIDKNENILPYCKKIVSGCMQTLRS